MMNGNMLSSYPLCEAAESAPTGASSAIQSQTGPQFLIQERMEMDSKNGVTHYLDEDTGNEISFEEHWARKQAEANPFYRTGQTLRTAADKLHHWIYKSVDSAINWLSDSFLGMSIDENKIHSEYQKLFEKITQAQAEARKAGKPLMVLVGEEHSYIDTALYQAMILHIANEKMRLKGIFTEAFQQGFYEKHNRRANCYPGKTVDELAKQMDIKIVPIDLALCGYFTRTGFYSDEPSECRGSGYASVIMLNDEVTGLKAMRVRNNVMTDVAIRADLGDTIAIVGGAHLYGLIEETPLTEYYHVLPINTFPLDILQSW